MQYLGGKYRIARHIEDLVLRAQFGRTGYVEPFLGGGATFSRNAPHFQTARGYDVVPDLVLMWKAVLDGWTPPTSVTEEEYQSLRNAEPSALRGFVGFGCSFGGKWFGGYARARNGEGAKYSHVAGSARSLAKQADRMAENSWIELADYREVPVMANDVVYADPPYRGTTAYAAAEPFDSDEFWDVARRWARAGAAVLVSEHEAPGDWVRVWAKSGPTYLRGDQIADGRTEAVFAPVGLAARMAMQ